MSQLHEKSIKKQDSVECPRVISKEGATITVTVIPFDKRIKEQISKILDSRNAAAHSKG
jgi:hypothetical protein